MVFETIPGLNQLNKIDFTAIMTTTGRIITFVIVFIFLALIVGFFYYKSREKKLYNQKLHFFEEVNGQMIPIKDYDAAELVVPNTDIRVFYVKTVDMYLPRGTKKMGKDAYWYAIRNNREVVNFIMKNLNVQMQEAGLDYDHTDMRYAHTNLKEIIKRNYKDKSTKWWKEYKDVISTIIFVFIFSLAFFFLFGQVSKLLGAIAPLLDHAEKILAELVKFQSSCGGAGASGVVTA